MVPTLPSGTRVEWEQVDPNLPLSLAAEHVAAFTLPPCVQRAMSWRVWRGGWFAPMEDESADISGCDQAAMANG